MQKPWASELWLSAWVPLWFARKRRPCHVRPAAHFRKERLLEARQRFLARVGDRLLEVQDDFGNIEAWHCLVSRW